MGVQMQLYGVQQLHPPGAFFGLEIGGVVYSHTMLMADGGLLCDDRAAGCRLHGLPAGVGCGWIVTAPEHKGDVDAGSGVVDV